MYIVPNAHPVEMMPPSQAEENDRSPLLPGQVSAAESEEVSFDQDDRIVVVDSFGATPSHGDWVRYVAATSSRLIHADDVGAVALPDSISSEAGIITACDEALRSVLDSDTSARVINLSSSRSPARLVYDMASHLLSWEDSLESAREIAHKEEEDRTGSGEAMAVTRQADSLISRLDLDPDATLQDILQAVVDYAQESFASDDVTEARANLTKTVDALHDKGVVVVISAGNNQEVADHLASLDVKFDADTFLDNSMGTEEAISVGAATRSARNYEVNEEEPKAEAARFSNAHGEVDIAADGTNITVGKLGVPLRYTQKSGTSFAAPQVAALLADMFLIDPDLRADEALKILQDTAVKPEEDMKNRLGAGLIRPEDAYGATADLVLESTRDD